MRKSAVAAALLALVAGFATVMPALDPSGYAASGPAAPAIGGASWSVLAVPSFPPRPMAHLEAVSCPAAYRCFAVGQYMSGSVSKTLIEHWNGSVWSIVASPNAPDAGSLLKSVSCPSVSNCFAVGLSMPNLSTAGNTLVEHWNGRLWSIVPSPNPGGAFYSQLSGVSCPAAASCFAVGDSLEISPYKDDMLVERWDGNAWSILASPKPALARSARLLDVSCTSPTGCFAVGDYGDTSFVDRTLVERWNGTAWSTVPSPSPVGKDWDVLFEGVSCTARTSCVAVGQYSNPSAQKLTVRLLTERWNGHAWSIVSVPEPADAVNLSDVSCTSATNCVAVGDRVNTSSRDETLVERWDGNTWSIVASPNAPGHNSLSGVSCTVATYCVAVGDHTRAGVEQPLIERYSEGYWMVGASGTVYAFGSAKSYGNATTGLATHIEPTPSRHGYWIADASGEVGHFGDAAFLGALVPTGAPHVAPADKCCLRPGENVVSMSATPSGKGYWLFTNTGRVFAFGDAPFRGDLSGVRLSRPIVGTAATPSGNGYYLVGADGGVFTFGDARFFGSTGAQRLSKPVRGIALSAGGSGYWLVASDGGVFTFGRARFRGSMGGVALSEPVTGIDHFGNGYLLVASDGGVFNFSDQPFLGSLGATSPASDITSIATTG